MSRKTKTVSICLQPDLHDWLRKYADRNHMSVSGALQQMVLAKAREEGTLNAITEETKQPE